MASVGLPVIFLLTLSSRSLAPILGRYLAVVGGLYSLEAELRGQDKIIGFHPMSCVNNSCSIIRHFI